MNIKTALGRRHLQALAELIQGGVDVNAEYADGQTPLIFASKVSNTRMIRLLLEHGADIDLQDSQGRPPIYHAARAGQIRAVKKLVDLGVNLDYAGDGG